MNSNEKRNQYSMRDLADLLIRNRAWSSDIQARDPRFFEKLRHQQTPQFLWIGCSDSRVPANEIVGLLPGELFVHRNVANVVVHADLNCLSVMQYAVDVLRVRHIIVCGHHGCGGISAALEGRKLGLIDNWLRHVQDVRLKHAARLEACDQALRADRLGELNVIEQVVNVCQTTVVQDAWDRGQDVSVHGWIYALSDGLLRDLKMCVSGPTELEPAYQAAVAECLG